MWVTGLDGTWIARFYEIIIRYGFQIEIFLIIKWKI